MFVTKVFGTQMAFFFGLTIGVPMNLVVGTFKQGLETSPVECPPVECGQSYDATSALDRKDRGSQSDRTLVVQ